MPSTTSILLGKQALRAAAAGATTATTTVAATAAVTNLRSSQLPTSILQNNVALFSAYGGSEPTLPDLPYDYNALEPAISTETMTLHHSKHHNTYVTNLKIGLDKLDKAISMGDISGMIALQNAIKFNGGGHVNHTLFWDNLTSPPEEGEETTTNIGEQTMIAITNSFGTIDNMKNQLSTSSIGIQGSGWGWLGYNSTSQRLEIATCSNQDPLQATTGLIPLLGIDVWEHAYYVDYRNVRPDYVKNIWNVINWKVVEERLVNATMITK